ncbi:AAA ATPase [Geranomyces variabilis]|uniref:Cell division control protein n=1 Tax=Geranomyces variabilis TaxID=109894 RepID=A0AAD5TPG2_9FUNG|nr:AAA ATPase [Geranomyces variabilis]
MPGSVHPQSPPAKRPRRNGSDSLAPPPAAAAAAAETPVVSLPLQPLGDSITANAPSPVPHSPSNCLQKTPQRGRRATACCAPASASPLPPTAAAAAAASPPASPPPHLTPRAVYAKAKTLFRRSTIPDRLVGRDTERAAVLDFWRGHVLARRPGSIYLSGIPGTGKTALVDEAARALQAESEAGEICVTKVNCMTVTEPEKIYAKLLAELSGKDVPTTNGELAVAELNEIFRKSAPKRTRVFHVVVLDEIDTLVTKDCRVLYKLFGWAQPDTDSCLALVGIGNSLDLTMRVLPRLAERNCQPISVKFDPYDIKSIINIINGRLRSLDPDAALLTTLNENTTRQQQQQQKQSLPLMKPMVVELCARKTAATGDLRKALDVCRSAIELAEAELTAKAATTKSITNPLDATITSPRDAPNVTIKHILAAAASAGAGGESAMIKIRPLSLQLKMLLCALVVGKRREGKASAPTLPALHELYVSIMRKRTRIAPVARTELQDLVTHLESRGLAVVTAQGARGGGGGSASGGRGSGKGGRKEDARRVRLAVTVDEVEEAVAGEPMLVEFLRGD